MKNTGMHKSRKISYFFIRVIILKILLKEIIYNSLLIGGKELSITLCKIRSMIC